MNNKVIKWMTMTTVVMVVMLMLEGFILGADVMTAQYGLNPVIIGTLGVIAEVVFDLTLACFLMACGQQLNWKSFKEFDFSSLTSIKIKGWWMNLLLVMNAIGWLSPFVYCFVAGFGKLPWMISLALLSEIIIHLAFCVYIKYKAK